MPTATCTQANSKDDDDILIGKRTHFPNEKEVQASEMNLENHKNRASKMIFNVTCMHHSLTLFHTHMHPPRERESKPQGDIRGLMRLAGPNDSYSHTCPAHVQQLVKACDIG